MPPIPDLSDVAEEGFFALASADTGAGGLVPLLRSDAARIKRGFPAAILENPAEAAFPILSFFAPTGPDLRPGIGERILQVDLFVWATGAEGGFDRLKALSARFLEIVFEQRWTATVDGQTFSLYGMDHTPASTPDVRGVLRRTHEMNLAINGPAATT